VLLLLLLILVAPCSVAAGFGPLERWLSHAHQILLFTVFA